MFFYFGHRRKWAWTWPTKHDSINLHQFTHLLREVCRAKNIWKGEWAQIHCLARATACYSLNMLRSCYSSPCVVQLGSKDCQSNGSVRVWRLAMMRSRRLPPALTCARSMCNMCNMCIPKLSSQVGSKGNQTVSWSNANLDETCMQPGWNLEFREVQSGDPTWQSLQCRALLKPSGAELHTELFSETSAGQKIDFGSQRLIKTSKNPSWTQKWPHFAHRCLKLADTCRPVASMKSCPGQWSQPARARPLAIWPSGFCQALQAGVQSWQQLVKLPFKRC
jgi:hypothetical protein